MDGVNTLEPGRSTPGMMVDQGSPEREQGPRATKAFRATAMAKMTVISFGSPPAEG
jgi:hypothetical protein